MQKRKAVLVVVFLLTAILIFYRQSGFFGGDADSQTQDKISTSTQSLSHFADETRKENDVTLEAGANIGPVLAVLERDDFGAAVVRQYLDEHDTDALLRILRESPSPKHWNLAIAALLYLRPQRSLLDEVQSHLVRHVPWPSLTPDEVTSVVVGLPGSLRVLGVTNAQEDIEFLIRVFESPDHITTQKFQLLDNKFVSKSGYVNDDVLMYTKDAAGLGLLYTRKHAELLRQEYNKLVASSNPAETLNRPETVLSTAWYGRLVGILVYEELIEKYGLDKFFSLLDEESFAEESRQLAFEYFERDS